jgi:hypothetical protein
VLCPNRVIGVGQRRQEPTEEEASKSAAPWGLYPVYPTGAAYHAMADSRESDIQNPDARYTNPAKPYPVVKKPCYDPSLDRAGWVSGCSATLPCRDSAPLRPERGLGPRARGWMPPLRGQRTHVGGPQRGSPRGSGLRKFSEKRRGKSF